MNKQELKYRCHEVFSDIQMYRDVPDAFDVQTDRMYVQDTIQELQDQARKLGCPTESVFDPTPDQALNIVAEIIACCNKDSDTLPTPAMLKDWYSPKELADLMQVSDYTVRERWCNDGRIECEKDNDSNKWRIPGHEVKRLLNGGKLGPKRGR